MKRNAFLKFRICFFQSAFSMGGGGMVGVTVATLPRGRCHQQAMSDTQVRMMKMVRYPGDSCHNVRGFGLFVNVRFYK